MSDASTAPTRTGELGHLLRLMDHVELAADFHSHGREHNEGSSQIKDQPEGDVMMGPC